MDGTATTDSASTASPVSQDNLQGLGEKSHDIDPVKQDPAKPAEEKAQHTLAQGKRPMGPEDENSQLDGLSSDLENSVRCRGALLTQAAGILLRLPQEIIAQAIVTFTRFYVGPEGDSFRVRAAKVTLLVKLRLEIYEPSDIIVIQDVSAAALYMTAKISFQPQSPRSVLNVYAYLLSSGSYFLDPNQDGVSKDLDPGAYYLSEGDYVSRRSRLLTTEALILRTLSFTTHVALPHHLALTYLQTLGVLPSVPTSSSRALARRTLAHLNTALLSPQLLYLTHQPPALAVAAIYLAAREVGVKLVNREWWEVFDVDREELGFLVVGMGSMAGWVEEERTKWAERRCPLTVEEVEEELGRGKAM
ncbi:hypothetical protein MMC11_006728 [Xylographa trunciseda]|nr:hypothetical protein [Xylographa trunciseda]